MEAFLLIIAFCGLVCVAPRFAIFVGFVLLVIYHTLIFAIIVFVFILFGVIFCLAR